MNLEKRIYRLYYSDKYRPSLVHWIAYVAPCKAEQDNFYRKDKRDQAPFVDRIHKIISENIELALLSPSAYVRKFAELIMKDNDVC